MFCTVLFTGTQRMAQPELDNMDDLPDFDVFVQHTEDLHYPGHWHPGTGEFLGGHVDPHEMQAHMLVQTQVPAGATLPSSYEAVH